MRIFLFIIFLIQSFCSVVYAQTDLLNNAVSAMEQKQYQKAIDNYTQIIQTNGATDGVLYNLANAYQAKGDFANAILHYEKALLISPSNSDINHNLTIAQELIENPIHDVNNFFISTGYWGFIKSFNSNQFSIMLVILILALLSILYLILFKQKEQLIKWQWKICLPLIALIALNFLMLSQRYHIESGAHAIIMNTSKMYSGADERSQELQDLDFGIKAEVLDSIDNWYKLNLPDMEQGWIQKSNIAIIKN